MLNFLENKNTSLKTWLTDRRICRHLHSLHFYALVILIFQLYRVKYFWKGSIFQMHFSNPEFSIFNSERRSAFKLTHELKFKLENNECKLDKNVSICTESGLSWSSRGSACSMTLKIKPIKFCRQFIVDVIPLLPLLTQI